MPDDTYIIHARNLSPMSGETEARGKRLSSQLHIVRNAHILVERDRIRKISIKKLNLNHRVVEYDGGYLVPPLVNAHTHLQLSWLKGRLTWNQGFTSWLKSLVPLLKKDDREGRTLAQTKAIEHIGDTGVKYIGDIGGTIPGALLVTEKRAKTAGIKIRQFCEWFGWEPCTGPYSQRCAEEAGHVSDPAPCGHALYSTSPDTLKKVKSWCDAHKKPFTLHLAESRDEEELLCDGSGPLFDFYSGLVLPDSWIRPGMRPASYAASLGLLNGHTLLVHGVHLNQNDINLLSSKRVSLCLCSRSNHYLNVGRAPVKDLCASEILLCLGTDGLTSCPDLDIREEAAYLRESFDIPVEAVIRMCTVNGIGALGYSGGNYGLSENSPARFAWLPLE